MNRRRPSAVNPLMAMVMVALLPAVVLWTAGQWADQRALSYDLPPPRSEVLVDGRNEGFVEMPPSPPLATPLVSLRRASVALSRDLNLETFRSDVMPLLDGVDNRSCVAVSLDGTPVGQRNANLPVIPASVQKVMVAAAALEILGDDYRYETWAVGEVGADGVVAGNLYLVGGGDPVLSGDWYPVSNLERFPVFNHTSLDSLADRVVAAGVTRIDGDVIGDGSRYDDEYAAPGWGAGVAGIAAGPYSALMANDSRVLGDDQRAADPREAAARELRRMLSDRGVSIAGPAGSGVAPAGSSVIASIESLALPGIIAQMLTNSDNNTAEMMVKELGTVSAGAGERPAGLRAMRAVFEEWGVDLEGVVLTDGSGLSRDNLLTCAAVVGVLQRFGAGDPIVGGLAVAGRSGTLAGAFTDGPVTGTLLGKTGTLNNYPVDQDPPAVKALAGYLPVAGGGMIEYALLLNGPTISDQREYRPIWDLLARTLATYPAGAGPDLLGPR